MNIFIDLDHLKSLAKTQDDEIKRLIKENFNIYYTFEEDDIKKEKRQKIQRIEFWQKNLSSGRNGKIVEYNASPFDYTNIERLQSVWLINDKCSFPSGLLSCNIGEELQTLRNLLIEGKCVPAKFYYTRPERNEEIQPWEMVSKNVSPCTDIIINDLYLFAQSENEYEDNAYKLIEVLCSRSVGQIINIVIVTKLNFKMRDTYHCINTTAIRNRIKSIIKAITNQDANITIIALDDDDYAQCRIHDRTIFTNYKLFISGDSFTYYLNHLVGNGLMSPDFISHGIWLGVCSLFDDDHNKIAMRFLHDIQNVISSVKKHLIFGNGISNFLSIPG